MVKDMINIHKRGNMIRGIRLTGNPGEVECRIGKSRIVLKTEFQKKGLSLSRAGDPGTGTFLP